MNTDYIVCLCNNCSGRIEFPTSGIGMEIDCPHCGLQTKLYQPAEPLTKSEQIDSKSETAENKKLHTNVGLPASSDFVVRLTKQKLVIGMLTAICLAVLVFVGWNKFNTAKAEQEAAKARLETQNQFAFEISSLITTLKDKSSLQYGIQPYLDYFDTNVRMYGGWLSSDEQDHLNKLIDELQSIQFFARKSDKEGMFADLSDEDKKMIDHCDLSSNSRVWFLFLNSLVNKDHPLVQTFRNSLISDGFDPDSAGGIKACSDYIDSLVAKAKAEKTAYNATACLNIMVERAGKSASELFDELTK